MLVESEHDKKLLLLLLYSEMSWMPLSCGIVGTSNMVGIECGSGGGGDV